ncbi:hypothetical protein BJ138DRAFT_1016153 [Hygrophoropsis aurantiaca]|uniref:Uncharacterized protein n=1 Tax=Hygrophoropsis aurantiaca TaxID=72124 RepID=A0ACB8A018_9AGAM|nr:hypothetical protein BJ138DRAFT_1016153 [Hygrophoropsis aurantiaca]
MGSNTDAESIRRRKLSKPNKNALDAEQRPPLTPVDGVGDQDSPKPKKFFKAPLHRPKKKKSLGNLPQPVIDVVPFPRELQIRSNVAAEDGAATLADHGDGSKVFEPRDRFVRKCHSIHHTYPRDEAPYMRAYDRTSLDNDHYTELLLRRLNPNGTPSFHNFAPNPPSAILDLGCGSGEWVLEAAAAWSNSQVIGLDLLQPTRLNRDMITPNNVRWVQGNFVHYKLPFPKDSFDLVRMANLSLCVPHNRWYHVLREVRRVLAPEGRLELIDDQIIFPYEKTPPHSPTTPTVPRVRKRAAKSDSSLDDDDEPDLSKSDFDEDETDEDFQSTRTSMSSFNNTFDDESDCLDSPASDWESSSARSKELETIFEQMLHRKFGIHPRPREVIEHVLDEVFGRYHSNKLSSMHLALAPATKDTDKATENGGKRKELKQWITTIEWDKKDKKDKDKKHKDKKDKDKKDKDKDKKAKEKDKGDKDKLTGEYSGATSQIPPTISAKAAGRLGITPSATSDSPARPPAVQSPGLILWPYTFIPIPPLELEMHACKNLHSLLGCKAALYEYLQDFKDSASNELPVISDTDFDESLWDYECFRRKRFNWRSETPEYRMDANDSESTPKSATFRPITEPRRPRGSSNDSITRTPLHPREDLTFVRSIHVYSASKIDEDFSPA